MATCLTIKLISPNQRCLISQQVALLKSAFHFRWQEKAMTYLGVQIPSRLDDLFDLNYVPLLTRTLTDLKTYDRPYFSWFGRINIVKMDILPRFLYTFQTVPIAVPHTYFRQLKSALLKFVWGSRKPRVRFTTLVRSKKTAGAGCRTCKCTILQLF